MKYYHVSHALLYMALCLKVMNERPVNTEGLLDLSGHWLVQVRALL